MRKLMALAIVIFMAGASRSWALAGMDKISVDGSLEVNGVSANNEVDLNKHASDGRGVTDTRVRLGINALVTEGVNGRVEITRSPASPVGTNAGAAALYGRPGAGAEGNDLNTEQSAWLINNAFVTFDNLWTLKAKLGRQYVGEAGDLVWQIGVKSDDALSINSIDGVNLDRTFLGEKLGVNLFTGKAKELASNVGTTDATTSGDVNLSNLSLSLKDVLPGAVITGAAMQGKLSTNATAGNINLDIFRLGLKGGVMEDMVTYKAEYLTDKGRASSGATKVNLKGSAWDLGLGANTKTDKIGKISIVGNYTLGSGDKNTTAGDHNNKNFLDFNALGVNTSDRYFGEIFGKSEALATNGAGVGANPLGMGLSNGYANRGLEVWNLGAKYVPPMDEGKYSVGLNWFVLNPAERKINGADRGKKFGDEYDLALGYDHSANVKMELGYAMLRPGKALAMEKLGSLTAPMNDVTKLYARATVKWGGEEK